MKITERESAADPLSGGRLTDLYQQHVGGAVALARLLTGDAQMAEDLAHEGFVRVAGRLAYLRHPDAFDAYLRRTVVNLCRAHFRRLRVEREWLRRQRPTQEIEDSDDDLAERDAIWRALQRLPYRQRAAVVLRYYEDLSVEQTGEVLKCSTRAANSLLARALAALRESLKENS